MSLACHSFRIGAATFILLCCCVLTCEGVDDVLSFNSLSSLYVVQDANTFSQNVEREINRIQFQKKLFASIPNPPKLAPMPITAHVKFRMKAGDDGGFLSVNVEPTGLSGATLDNAAGKIVRYVGLRARGYSESYVSRLIFLEDIQKTVKKLDRVGRAIINKYPNVLPSRLKRVSATEHHAGTKVTYEVRDGGYSWKYDVLVNTEQAIEEIYERLPVLVKPE